MAKTARKPNGGGSLFSLAFLLAPAVIFVFFAGVFVGSSFVGSHPGGQIGAPLAHNSFGSALHDATRGLRGAQLQIEHQLHLDGVLARAENTAQNLIREAMDRAPAPESPDSMVPPAAAAAAATRAAVPQVAAPVQPLPPPSTMPLPVLRSATERRESFATNGGGSLQLNKPWDAAEMSVATWAWLDPTHKDERIMKTLFSNKEAGCEVHAPSRGYALFVNNWETADGSLVLEFGTTETGCAKISSVDYGVTAPFGRWFHVAATWTAERVTLFLDGKEVGTAETAFSKLAQSTTVLTLGKYPDSQYAYAGNLSALAFFDVALDEAQVWSVAVATQHPTARWFTSSLMPRGLVGAFGLLETAHPARGKPPSTQALELLSWKPGGTYEVPWAVSSGQGGSRPSSVVQVKAGQSFAVGGLSSAEELTVGVLQADDAKGRRNALQVKAAMQHAWSGYKKYAWGQDELKPVSNRGHDNWGGLAVTMVDSLDTLWLMGMKTEFEECRQFIRQSLRFDHTGSVSVFETTIRELGGLLSAFDLSGEVVFLEKAEDLGKRLLRAFDSPSGLPYGAISLKGGRGQNAGWTGNQAILSEVGTLQVEFRYLSEMTGNPVYAQKANKAFDVLCRNQPGDGLFPIYVSTESARFNNNKITFGALGDSFYEYLLKVWHQGGQSEQLYRHTYDRSMDGMVKKLLQASEPSKFAYIADLEGGRLKHKMDHLVCFMGGSLALGAFTDPDGLDSPRAQRDLSIGKALAHTCYQMYARTATGVAAEWYQFRAGGDMGPGPGGAFNILRPEAIETMFIMHQLTKDPVYREWGWRMFTALEKHCKTRTAFGGLSDVNSPRRPDDRMESFFLAETLKYHYLLQSPVEDHGIDLLHSHVFNTEAHPLSLFGSRRWKELRAQQGLPN